MDVLDSFGLVAPSYPDIIIVALSNFEGVNLI